MIARRYHKQDIEVVNEWYAGWNHPTLLPHMLPDVGFIVDEVCAGFLYKTDSSLCLLDAYVANREATKAAKQLGLDLVTNALLEEAYACGFRAVMAITDNPSIVKRCINYKFKDEGTRRVFVREL